MRSIVKKNINIAARKLIARGINSYYICSFTEFNPFCPALYYFSSFKDFKTNAGA